MEDEPSNRTEGTQPPKPVPGIPPLPDDLAHGEEEVRRLIDAGAGSPEELRALAERLREQRAREEEAWRREVKPALLQSKKARGTFAGLSSSREREGPTTLPPHLGAVLAVLGVIIVLLLVASVTTPLVLVIPVVGVLVYAYQQGRVP